ncbi:MAG: thiosulfohydrolase SoxB [Betaproteobacteria bacterium]|nr:MAG: thiosulfohydrolase SoxB [Betaproteobacteria bacterium]
MQRRAFLRLLALAAAAGATLRPRASDAQAADQLYELAPFGNVSLLHITDVHAQLLPVHFREPNVNIGDGHPPHLVGERLLGHYAIAPGSAQAHAFTHLDFEAAARRYGRMGGYAHIATLMKRLRASRPHALVLDGGDSWHGSATALWTQGADMIGAQRRLGVQYMTAHWEFTYGAERMLQAVKELAPIQFLAQNVRTVDFEDPVFTPYAMHEGVAIIGQAFPYTPIAHPRHRFPDWSFGIQEARLQKLVDETRAKGARAVVLLSHNGMDVDLKLAGRVHGIDAILGGHTHDGVPAPVLVGKTLVTNAGSHGKFIGVLDLQVDAGGVRDYRYRLLPVFANLLSADADMAAYIAQVRAPHAAKLAEKLAVSEGLLYRRGNFNGTMDELILRALLEQKEAEIALSPGFRWGATLLPGDAITREDVMAQTAITYPQVTTSELTGAEIKTVLEDVADNLFNSDPYRQQGGDMVRVGGMSYAIAPRAKIGSRISELRLRGKPLDAGKRYKVAGWAPVREGETGEPVWEAVERHLRGLKSVPPLEVNRPRLVGVGRNPGLT